MISLRQFAIRFAALLRKKRLEQELRDEVRAHLEFLAEENAKHGMSPEEARYAALREFGGVEPAKEVYRDQRGLPMIESLFQDLRYGIRMLAKTPGFTSVVVLSLALGIGANTAIFSLLDAVMIKMLPVKNPQQLVELRWAMKGWPDAVLDDLEGSSFNDGSGGSISPCFSYPTYHAIQERNHVFSDTFAVAANDIDLNVGIAGRAESAVGRAVSGNYFSALGVPAAMGRTIQPADDSVTAPPVAVFSYDFWSKRFARGPDVLGKTVVLDGTPFTVVGIMPPEFFGLEAGSPADITVPLSLYWRLYQMPEIANEPRMWWMHIDGRLKPGVTQEQANAELKVLFHQIMTAAAGSNTKAELPEIRTLSVSRGLDTLRRRFSKPLWVLTALVGMVLLIACANVASLLLARATARQKEIAVRLSLGSGRRRLVRQLLTESVLLAIMGGAAGLLVASWADSLLLALMSSGRDPLTLGVHLDSRMLLFTAALSILTGVLFGLVPALRATRVDLTPALKDSTLSQKTGGLGLRPGKALVVVQIAICMLILVGAGLFVRTLRSLENLDVGFNREHLLLFSVSPGLNGYKGTRLGSLYQEMQQRIANVPGVKSVTLLEHTLIAGGMSINTVSIPGYTPDGKSVDIHKNLVGPRFIETMGIPLLLGRSIGERDIEGAPRVAMVNQAAVKDFFHGDNPIGKQIDFGNPKKPHRVEVVGVVGNTKYGPIRDEEPSTVFLPYLQDLGEAAFMSFEVRTAKDPNSIVEEIRSAAQSVDKDLPLLKVQTENEQIEKAVFLERLFARLTSIFGFLGLTLACVGLYGIMAYAVARRTKEIGIRLAFGAQRSDILQMVMRETALLIALGVAIGLAGAVATTRLISSFLFGLEPTDPLTLVAATLLMAAVVALAGYLPARRATKVDPMTALRYE
jgi:predicted permease